MKIPHAPIPLEEVRPLDIWVLLGVGACYEVMTRTMAYLAKSKSKHERGSEQELRTLRFETAKKRRLGPSAFVETSKLERSVLAKEKELAKQQEARKIQSTRIQQIIRNFGLALYAFVFMIYYGIPLLVIDGMGVSSTTNSDLETELLESSDKRAAAFLRAILFPISYVGIGLKFARLGVENPASSIGALVVLWSGQVTVGKIIDCIEMLLP